MTKDDVLALCDCKENFGTPKYDITMTFKDEVVLTTDFDNDTICTMSPAYADCVGEYTLEESDWAHVRAFKEIT